MMEFIAEFKLTQLIEYAIVLCVLCCLHSVKTLPIAVVTIRGLDPLLGPIDTNIPQTSELTRFTIEDSRPEAVVSCIISAIKPPDPNPKFRCTMVGTTIGSIIVAQSLVGGQGQYEVTVMAFDQFRNEDLQTVNITVVSTSPDSDTVSTQLPVSQSTKKVSSQRTSVTSTVTPATPVTTEPTTTTFIVQAARASFVFLPSVLWVSSTVPVGSVLQTFAFCHPDSSLTLSSLIIAAMTPITSSLSVRRGAPTPDTETLNYAQLFVSRFLTKGPWQVTLTLQARDQYGVTYRQQVTVNVTR